MKCFKLFFTSVLLLMISTAAQANTFVGTGGEGVIVGNHLYVRDLYEYGHHLSPWIGPNIDPMLVRELGSWNPLMLTKEQMNLLQRKLNDANQVSPRLGTYLIMALRYYDWRLTDLPLSLPPESESRFEIPEEDRLAVANRYMQSIVVHRMNFIGLNDENKVALLIHEAIYSLVKTSYRFPFLVTQSVTTTRMLTAALFSDENGARRMHEMVPLFLNVPPYFVNRVNTQVCSLAMLGMFVTDSDGFGYASSHLERPFDALERSSFVYKTYQAALEAQARSEIGVSVSPPATPLSPLTIHFFFPPTLVLRPNIYLSENGQQVELKVEDIIGYSKQFPDSPQVFQQIMSALDAYYAGIDCR